VQKYVLSSTLADPGWEPTTVPGGDVVAAGPVEEYRLFTYPVVQGRGRRLLPDGVEVPRLRRLDAGSFEGGVTYAAHAPVG
jgi:hypothetical protein